MYYHRSLLSRFLDIPAEVMAGIFMLFACGACLWISVAIDSTLGVNGFGPVRQYDVTIVSKHIDAQKDSSSYMVVGDSQTFEVDNGPLLDMYNADVVYGNILPGVRYCLTAKGNQVTNFWMQQYPYIQKAVQGGCDK